MSRQESLVRFQTLDLAREAIAIVVGNTRANLGVDSKMNPALLSEVIAGVTTDAATPASLFSCA
jgi:hypothetical protein